MKKVMVVSLTAFAFIAISATVLFTSCQKKSVEKVTYKETKKEAMIPNIDHLGTSEVWYERGQPIAIFLDGVRLMNDGCQGYNGVCHWGPPHVGNGLRFYQVSGGKVKAENIDPYVDGNSILIHPNTIIPEAVASGNGIVGGYIVPGVYPLIMDIDYPNGYFEFDLQF